MISRVVVAIQNLELLNFNIVNENNILFYFLIMNWVANFLFVLKLVFHNFISCLEPYKL
jgi:hypothetical protein